MRVTVIGGGLAGVEATYQLVKNGIEVDLYEMRPQVSTGAHKTENFAELVCSNSLRADGLSNAVGVFLSAYDESNTTNIIPNIVKRIAEKYKLSFVPLKEEFDKNH